MNEAAFSLVGKIGWTLIHFAWQGLVVGLATAALLSVLRTARPQQRYAVACGALFLCLAWPCYELYQRIVAPLPGQFGAALMSTATGPAHHSGLIAALQDKLVWVVALWAVCATLMALRMAFGLLWLARTARTHVSPPVWQHRVTRMASDWGIARQVRVYLADDLASPLTAGWLRPIILLPTSVASGMPSELLEALLAHEMAHIRRLDYLVNLGQNLVEMLLFYHPAVWWISGRIRSERELIADELAAERLDTPRTLALALSELERYQSGTAHLALAANGGELALRIRRLLRPGPNKQAWSAVLPVLGLALAGVVLVACAQPAKAPAITTKAVAIFKSCVKPMYPAESLRAGHTGTVALRYLVANDGTVKDSAIVRSSGHRLLDTTARDAIALCRFTPAQADGKAVESWAAMQYVWTLTN